MIEPDAKHHQAVELILSAKHDEARLILESNHAEFPEHYQTISSLGWFYKLNGDLHTAHKLIREAIKLNPLYAQAYSNLAGVLYDLGEYDSSLGSLNIAIKLNPTSNSFKRNKGLLLLKLGKLNEAISTLENCNDIHKDEKSLVILLQLYSMTCSWNNNYYSALQHLKQIGGSINPWILYSLVDDPALHLHCSTHYAHTFLSEPLKVNHGPAVTTKRKRIGYISANICTHPMMVALSEVIKQHDRNYFEVFIFYIGQSSYDTVTKDLADNVENFIDLRGSNWKHCLSIIRNTNLDCAFDLMGFTEGNYFELFNSRIAPVQISMIGHAGTLGSSKIDYILADKVVIPHRYRHFYSEKILYKSGTFLAAPSKRDVQETKADKSHHGLSDSAFIFACFNNTYKLTPDIFAAWVNIIRKVESSQLWLLDANQCAKNNLYSICINLNIDPKRIIFASRCPMRSHLERYKFVDLFLDTNNYSAHVTALDCLGSATPLLTLQGKSFASRVASSVLYSLGLPELVTYSLDQYEAMAYLLASDSDYLDYIKEKLSHGIKHFNTFKSDAYLKELEKLINKCLGREQNGRI